MRAVTDSRMVFFDLLLCNHDQLVEECDVRLSEEKVEELIGAVNSSLPALPEPMAEEGEGEEDGEDGEDGETGGDARDGGDGGEGMEDVEEERQEDEQVVF